MMLPRHTDATGCECPTWQPTERDDDGDPCGYVCPDDDCRCPVHCAEEDFDYPDDGFLTFGGDALDGES